MHDNNEAMHILEINSMKMGSLGLFHEFQMLRNCHHISVYLETHGLACWKDCAQEFEREERGAVTRVWGFFGNSVSSGELKTLCGFFVGGGEYSLFFLKDSAALLRTLL